MQRVAIIGTGVAGLAMAKTLLSEGLECVLYERGDRLGGVWADGHSNFGVQAPKECYQFPDWPLPEDVASFTPGVVFQKYLENYVDHFKFRSNIRFNTCVMKLEPRVAGAPGWRVISVCGDKGSRGEDFDFVVVATGLFSNVTNIPSYPGKDEYQGAILHSSEVRTRTPLIDKNIVVVGYGKSAADVALEAAVVAKDVHIILREAHWPVPRKLAGILPIKWGSLNRLASSFLPLYQRPSLVEKYLHSFGKPLVWIFWRLLEFILRVQCHLGTTIANGKNLLPSIPFEIDSFGEATMVASPELYPLIREGRISAHRTEIDHYTSKGIVLKDGTELPADCVVLATGWKSDFGYLPDDVVGALEMETDGMYLYRHMLHPDLSNLAFIGRATSFVSVLTYCLQARWLAEFITGRLDLPESAVLVKEIEEMKAWKRSWMPYSPARGARLFLHAQHYHDELMIELGLEPLRKKGIFAPVKELFSPYVPEDYRSVVAGKNELKR